MSSFYSPSAVCVVEVTFLLKGTVRTSKTIWFFSPGWLWDRMSIRSWSEDLQFVHKTFCTSCTGSSNPTAPRVKKTDGSSGSHGAAILDLYCSCWSSPWKRDESLIGRSSNITKPQNFSVLTHFTEQIEPPDLRFHLYFDYIDEWRPVWTQLNSLFVIFVFISFKILAFVIFAVF